MHTAEVAVWTCVDPAQDLLVEGLLQAQAIPYLVRNDYFGAMFVGPSIPGYNQRVLLVSETDVDDARAAIAGVSGSMQNREQRRRGGFSSSLSSPLSVGSFPVSRTGPLSGVASSSVLEPSSA